MISSNNDAKPSFEVGRLWDADVVICLYAASKEKAESKLAHNLNNLVYLHKV